MGSIRADGTHMYQLFSNLIGNGILHNDASYPVLRISRLPDDDSVQHFVICDNGSGISEDLIENLFEPFTRSEHGGAGLGLSIAQKVVDIYGGAIRAYNDNGACFEVTMKDYPAE
jgi:signal transduction histidine kinase